MASLLPYYNKYGMNGFFKRFFGEDILEDMMSNEASVPFYGFRADIAENECEYTVTAELPGISKENIQLDLQNDILIIRASYNEEAEDKTEQYIRRERRRGQFARSFHVDTVNTQDITASLADGILTVHLPKKEQKDQSTKIEIQ